MNDYQPNLIQRIGNYSKKAAQTVATSTFLTYATLAGAYAVTAMPTQAYAAEEKGAWKKKTKEKAAAAKGKVKESAQKVGKKLKNMTAEQSELVGQQVGGVIISIPLGFVHGVKKAVTSTEDYQRGVDIVNRYLTEEGRRQKFLDERRTVLYQGEQRTAELAARLSTFDTANVIAYEDPNKQRLRETLYTLATREIRGKLDEISHKKVKELFENADRKTLEQISDLAYLQIEPMMKPVIYGEIDRQLATLDEQMLRELQKELKGTGKSSPAPKAASASTNAASAEKEKGKPAKKKKREMTL